MVRWELWIAGVAQPQGSARAFKRGQHLVVTSDNAQLRPWRHAVTSEAQQKATVEMPLRGPLELQLDFVFPWLKSHYTPKGAFRKGVSDYHTVRPDLDKLARAVIDSLAEAGVFQNDAQVSTLVCSKGYGERPGCRVRLVALNGQML